jgi:glycosyltransferase involved in cell wall biosynthesis
MQQQRTRYLEHAQLVITPSIYLGNLVAGWGIDKDRIATIFNGIQSERFKQSESIRRRNGVLRAIFVGRLTNWKGVETLLLAMRELPLVHLTIVGDGPAMPYLQQLAKQIRQDGTILFLGRLEKELLYREMSQAHVTVLNSLYEGLSHVLLESCAMGIPCIASQCGGNKEVIRHNINGMLIPPQDVSALVGALQNLCDNEEKRYMMAQEAKKTANMFNFKKTLEQIVDVLNLQ